MVSFKFIKFIVPVVFTLSVIFLFKITGVSSLKIYPSLMNFLFFVIFFVSLFSEETVIQRIARKMDGKLEEPVLTYTKNLTYIWVIFLFVNFLISVISMFLSDNFWLLYNGVISYLLVGMMFVVEYPIRKSFKKRHNL
ncbi:MAG: hypothetical protein ACI37Z_09655 [Candidatus Gastranaerophilaceae bacterium]